MEHLNRAIALAHELPDLPAKKFIIDELRKNTRLALTSVRIVLLSTLTSEENHLSPAEKDVFYDLMRLVEDLRATEPRNTPISHF